MHTCIKKEQNQKDIPNSKQLKSSVNPKLKNNSLKAQEDKAIQQKMNVETSKVEIIQKKQNKTGLPDSLKSAIENLSGHTMDDVKVHYNSSKPAKVQAHAYAQGTDIHLASGQEKHLPHEAWHVAQQKQGRVKPTTTIAGMAVNDNVGLEKEADIMGGKATNIVQQKKIIQSKTSLTVMKVAQLSMIEKFKELLPNSDASRAAPIVNDFAERAEQESLAEEKVNYEDVFKIAEAIGYKKDYATRLAKKTPFEVTDLEKHTSVELEQKGVKAITFNQFSMHDDMHKLGFDNVYYEKGKHILMNVNYRHPLLMNAYLNDVVVVQKNMVANYGNKGKKEKKPKDIKTVKRKNIVTKDGLDWFKAYFPKIKNGELFELTVEQLDSFLGNGEHKGISNGKNTRRIAKDDGSKIISGSLELVNDEYNMMFTLQKVKKSLFKKK